MTSNVVSLPSLDDSPFWEVHEHQGRALDSHAMRCSCDDCKDALHIYAQRTPKALITRTTNCDRVTVTAEYLAKTMASDESLRSLLYVDDDWVRSLYVPTGQRFLHLRQRWHSLACDEDDWAAGRRPAVH